ncbi:MAG: N-acetylmuramoyl-L-alanine amidase [Candidatus Aminicenantes bacterium]|nr:N-acetylmuramoyl-L-alanine amidase [Candidatus Aminicenantes bacterium]
MKNGSIREKLTVWAVSLLILSFLADFSTAESYTEIYDLRHWTHPTYTRIVIDIGEIREYEYHELSSPDRIYIDVFQAKLNPILEERVYSIGHEYLDQIRIAQRTVSTVRVVIDVKMSLIKRTHVFHLPDPFRIVIDIYPVDPILNSIKEANKAKDVSPKPAVPAQDGYSLVRQLGLGIKRIVIDPGHGGKDPGCIGSDGLLEKDIVLDVCHRLKKLMTTTSDMEIILTRETDIYLPPENRTVVANQKKADLFISVHVNSHPNKKHSGIETFFLNFSQDPSVNQIAARENATSTKSISMMKDILEKLAENSKIVESKELATLIQKNLAERLAKKYNNVRSLGVKGGPFWVLIGGEMPSVLVEISHLSNKLEGDRLKTSQYRQEIAQGIYEGIVAYKQSLGKG